MSNIPIALTDNEFREIAEAVFLDNGGDEGVYNSIDEAEEDVRDHWAFKIERYITDGPGYSGTLYVIIWGFSDVVTTLERDGDGPLRAYYLTRENI